MDAFARYRRAWSFRVAVTAAAVVALFSCSAGASGPSGPNGEAAARNASVSGGASRAILVVAAENFYGDVARQIGGRFVHVESILNDPGADPHDYQSTVGDAKMVAGSALVVRNGGGYDPWMDKLLAGSPRPGRAVVTAYDVAVRVIPNNEHVWYGLDNMQAVANAISAALSRIDPGHAADYEQNLQAFQKSLNLVRSFASDLRDKFDGVQIALTETIFRYQADTLGLDVLTPVTFEQAVAEGYDPPADAFLSAQAQIRSKRVKVFIYNSQTEDAITAGLRKDADDAGIPTVAVTETMPSGTDYQSWMQEQLHRLGDALARSVGAHPAGLQSGRAQGDRM